MSEKTITRKLLFSHVGARKGNRLGGGSRITTEKLITLSPLSKQFSLTKNSFASKDEKIKLTERSTKINLNIESKTLGNKKPMISQELRNISNNDPLTELDLNKPELDRLPPPINNFVIKSSIKTRNNK